MTFELLISICIGIGLAASAGFRVFVPLFLTSLAAYFNILPLNEELAWAGSLAAVIILGVATVVEIMAYFIPVVDNFLDTVSVPLAAIAGTGAMISVLGDMSPAYAWALAIIAGGGTASVVSGSTSAARATSTATTAGLANPIFSGFEAVASFLLSLISIFLPLLALAIVVYILFSIRKIYRRIMKKASPKLET